jgi:hypothetical protein
LPPIVPPGDTVWALQALAPAKTTSYRTGSSALDGRGPVWRSLRGAADIGVRRIINLYPWARVGHWEPFPRLARPPGEAEPCLIFSF